jgi:3'(2'), 5'-bisphosphate nucleotidase
MDKRELDRRLQIVRALARQAGDVIMNYYKTSVEVELKAPGDPVTEADKAANELIVDHLRKTFPGEAVLAEESTDDLTRLGRDVVWMVDPMDGTKEFISRNGEFSAMIGMIESGKPVLGAVMQPAAARLYCGAVGLGAWMSENGHDRAIRVSAIESFAEMRIVASRSHFEKSVDRLRQRLGIDKLIRSGSVGLKCGLIARGDCEIYVHPSSHAKLWDSCAPSAVLTAAGGTMTDLRGAPLNYSSKELRLTEGIAASNGRMHDRLIEMIVAEKVEVK